MRSALNYRNQFILRMRMPENTRTARYFHAVNPRTALVRVAEQLRSLSPIRVE
jgi:hypothetical protein